MKIVTIDDWNPVHVAGIADDITHYVHVALEHEGVVLGFLTMAGVRVLREIGFDWDERVAEYYAKWVQTEDRAFDDFTIREAKEM